ncbi:formate dehydrogenase, partial [Streptomyces sp. SID4985]|nr:formate dehydrogenase [Streptomyces sp. SID4985]
DRYRGIKNLRELVFMNEDDMRERGISEFDPVNIVSTAKDGSHRYLDGYLAIPYDMPRGCAAGYMPEMNVLIALCDYSTQSDQPLMKQVRVHITPAT